MLYFSGKKGIIHSRFLELETSGTQLAIPSESHTTPRTGFGQGQDLDNPLCYPRLPILYTLTRQHSELVFFPDSELRAQTVRHIQEPTT
jgi:hypothetical protein